MYGSTRAATCFYQPRARNRNRRCRGGRTRRATQSSSPEYDWTQPPEAPRRQSPPDVPPPPPEESQPSQPSLPSNKAPAHTKAIPAGVPAPRLPIQANHSTKQAGKPRCAGSWWPTPLTSRRSVMSSWNSGHTSHHKTTRWPKEGGHIRPRSCWTLQAGASQKVANLVAWQPGSFLSHFSTM